MLTVSTTTATTPRPRATRVGSTSSGINSPPLNSLRPQSIISTRPNSVISTTTLYDSISSKDSNNSTLNLSVLRPRSISASHLKPKYGRLSAVNELIDPEEDEFISKIQDRLNVYNAIDPFEYNQDYIQSLIPSDKNIYCKLPKPKEEVINVTNDENDNNKPLERKDSFSLFMERDDEDQGPLEGRRSTHRHLPSTSSKKSATFPAPGSKYPDSASPAPKSFWANLFSPFNFGTKAADKTVPKPEPTSNTRVRRQLGRPMSMHLPTSPVLALHIDTSQNKQLASSVPRKSFADYFSQPPPESSPSSRQTRALIQAGVTAFEHGEFVSAAELFKIATNGWSNTPKFKSNNNVVVGLAWYGYGMCLLHAFGVPRDPKNALKCLHNSAEAGEALGMFSLSMCYNHGMGCEEMDEETRKREMSKYLKMAADAGNAEAMIMVLGLAEFEQTNADHGR